MFYKQTPLVAPQICLYKLVYLMQCFTFFYTSLLLFSYYYSLCVIIFIVFLSSFFCCSCCCKFYKVTLSRSNQCTFCFNMIFLRYYLFGMVGLMGVVWGLNEIIYLPKIKRMVKWTANKNNFRFILSVENLC